VSFVPMSAASQRNQYFLNGQHLRKAAKATHLRLMDLQERLQEEAAPRAGLSLEIKDHGKPRLWLDHYTNIVMEPDHRSYRLVQENGKEWQGLYETCDQGDILHQVRHFAETVLRSRGLEVPQNPPVAHAIPAISLAKTMNLISAALLGLLGLVGIVWLLDRVFLK
jgi:hypothetical protein